MPDTFTDEEIGLTPLSDEDIGLKQLAADELKRKTFEARIEGQQAKAIQAIADIGAGASYWVADALAKGDPTGVASQMLARQGVQRTPTVLSREDIDTVLEVAKKGLHIPETAPAEGKLGEVTRGLSEAGKEMVVGMSDPGMLAGLGLAKAAPQEGARLFQYQLMGALPSTTEQALQAQNLEEAVKGGVGVAANVAFPIALNSTAAGPRIRIPEDFKVEPIQLRPEPTPIEKAIPETPKFEEKPATEPSILAPEKPEVAPVSVAKPEVTPLPKLSNKAIGTTWNRLVSTARGDLDELILNWNTGELSPDGSKITVPIGRDRTDNVNVSKKSFFQWLYSDDPLDPKSFDQSQQWVDLVNRTRENAGLKPKEVTPIEKPVEEPAKPAAETKAVDLTPSQEEATWMQSAFGKYQLLHRKDMQVLVTQDPASPEMIRATYLVNGEPTGHQLFRSLSALDEAIHNSVKVPESGRVEDMPLKDFVELRTKLFGDTEDSAKATWEHFNKKSEPLSDEQIGLTKEAEVTKPVETPVEAVGNEGSVPKEYNGGTIRVTHGGTGVMDRNHPMWFTPDEYSAKWYAEERGGDNPVLLNADVTINKPARNKDILEAAKSVRATQKDIAKGMGQPDYEKWQIDAPSDYAYVPKVVRELKRRGFDGIIEWDDLENTQILAVIPFEKSQIKEVSRVTGSRTPEGTVYKQLSQPMPETPAEPTKGIITGRAIENWADDVLRGGATHAGPDVLAPSKLEQLTAKVESGQKLTTSEKKQYLKLRQEATSTAPEAEKPIVGMGGAAIGEKNPKTQIEQLTETAQGIVPKKLPLGERLKQDVDLTRKREILAEGAAKAIGALRDTWNGIKNRWNGIENVDDLLREKGKLSAEIETRGWRVRKFESEMKKAVPSKRDRAAISKWVDAGGDPEVLKRGALETKPEYRQAYIDALDLRGDLLTTAQNARNYFEARLNEAIDAGVLKEGVEDYIHRVYESRPEVAKKVFANVQTGLLQRNPNLAKKRVFDFDFEAEKLGYKPVQSFIDRIALYESSLSKAIAAREFIKKATEMKADDGRPVIDIKGVGIPVENAEGVREGTLIKPKFNPQLNNEPGSPNYRGDYVNKEFPSLSRWKWVSTDAGGKPIFVQGDVAIHPDFVHRINALLEPSRLRYGRYSKITKPMLDVGSAVKQTMLDLSGFHQVQITAHGLEHKVLPWKIVKDIDFNNPNVEGLLKGGITLGGDYRAAYKEGLVGNSITRHVPWLGPVLESYHQWLFQSYIPRIKMTMALQALERNRIRYGKTMTDEQILHKTAAQANSAFGELNYIMLERSKTTQDIARLILLAPDFLEARGRFAGEAFTKGGESKVPGFGNEQRAALLLGALTMYVTARIANKVVDDQYHFEPENAFSLVYKGHAYSLRTVQGDILHLLEKPLQFWLNRLNPVYGRTLLEIVTGRDYFGRKRSVPEVLWDSVKNVMPISLRNSRERKLWESMMNSFGVNARRYNATDDAFKLANAWKEKNGIQERGEFIYDAEKDPLRGLKIALSQEDDAGAAKEIKKIFDSKVYDRKRLDAYFKRYASMPFTGSKANDIKFIKSLNEDERKTVEAAKQHKRDMLKLYDQALQKYYAALRTPIQ